jgi:hypothetical protein
MSTNVDVVVAVVGSRSFCNYGLLASILEEFRKDHPHISLVSGGAAGADRLAERYAKAHRLPMTVLKPDWKTHGKKAGLLRNTDIVKSASHVFAFWDGKSPGTKDSIQKAQELGKILYLVKV